MNFFRSQCDMHVPLVFKNLTAEVLGCGSKNYCVTMGLLVQYKWWVCLGCGLSQASVSVGRTQRRRWPQTPDSDRWFSASTPACVYMCSVWEIIQLVLATQALRNCVHCIPCLLTACVCYSAPPSLAAFARVTHTEVVAVKCLYSGAIVARVWFCLCYNILHESVPFCQAAQVQIGDSVQQQVQFICIRF